MNLLSQIHKHCQLAPDSTAIVDAGGVVSYRLLWRGAHQLAERLSQHLATNTRFPVAVCMSKSAETVMAFMACWMCDVPYIPMLPNAPRERLLQMLRSAQAQCVCVDEVRGASDLAFHDWLRAQGLTVIPVERSVLGVAGQIAAEADGLLNAFRAVNASTSVAAILFTSGSTGSPKAAQITHGNLEHFVGWVHHAFDLRADERLASHAAFQFDLCFLDLYGCLTCGASVHLVPESIAGSGSALAQWVNGHAITLWQSVPSVLGLMAQAAIKMPGVRQVLFAGERMPHARLLSLHAIFPQATFYNIYGCTETNNTFMYTVPARQADIPDPLPIGRALPATHYRILDQQMTTVASGDSGVLWVNTPTLMRGYLDTEHTADVIKTMALENGELRRYYLTNDVVRELPSGDLEYLGRNDWVLKTSGYRVSLQEIEAAIDLHQSIAEVGVIGIPDADLGHRLIAVVRPRQGVTLNTLQLKMHCGKCLPRYMIPHQFLFRDQDLPKNGNGKLDRKVLQQELSSCTH
jgi:amino acid adenylation domain-containing protein